MKNTLSLRYAQAFIEVLGEEKCKELLQKYEEIKALYAQEDFIALLHNPFIHSQKKSQVVLEILNIEAREVHSGIEVLSNAGRLKILPNILNKMIDIFASKQQIYQAVLYSQTKTSAYLLEKISTTLSSKVGGKVQIVQKLWEKDGIKCVIEDLDLEISFSQNAFIQHLKEYILDTFKKGV
ncbi:F0F1 ATP synthase subunit delta [Helicobacter cholecystus]|uniref:F0F1 ATP synthase subunit delta n=1 Tax=Helicobacter cholecystus TaxID=45498 RepID=UPI002739EC38|nr:F0F1 ATP synthase subunit delta [Helicobacter cholecystus]